MIVWCVGRVVEAEGDMVVAWDLVGIFSSEKQAVEACRGNEFFVGPIIADKFYPYDSGEMWSGAYFPLQNLGIQN
jgi:hypothetical protein